MIERAVRLGLDGVEHGYQLTGDVARLMAERGVALVPTLVVTRCGDFFDQLDVPCWMQQRSLSAGPRHLESYGYALEAGVEVMLGSDMPPFWEFEGTTATVRELEWMIEGGLPLSAAVQAATAVPARWLGVGDELGTIEPGKRADLVALAADPLSDARAWRTLWFVMKEGVDRAQRPLAAMTNGPDDAADVGAEGDAETVVYDLRVTVDRIEGRSVCGMRPGDHFDLVASNELRLPDGKHFCIYALASVLPFLAAKQRQLPAGDWLERDVEFACPDPDERLTMRVERIGVRRLRTEDLT